MPNAEQAYWEQRWLSGETGWDIRQASPALMEYAASIPAPQRHLSILIPGCGNGYEAIQLLQLGFSNITMLDIAPSAVAAMQSQLDKQQLPETANIQLICGDFFEHQGRYDLILEQTFFCALPPTLRSNYVVKMKTLLTENGRLAGVLFNRDFQGGPPFGGSQDEYETLFSNHFNIQKMAPCYNSIPPRAGAELFFILTPKSNEHGRAKAL